MSTARIDTLARLRGSIGRIEAHGGDAQALNKTALGHADADAALQGGLALAAVHEVFAEGHQSGAATGFIAGLAARLTPRRPLVWVRQDFSELESGALSMSGFRELGLDPRLLVTVRAADAEAALRAAADALACDALGGVVLEVWGAARQLDLVASRKLTLAAQASGVTALLLRVAASHSPRRRKRDGSCARRIRRLLRLQCLRCLGAPGARRCSTLNSFVTVMARLGGGSWNGNVMSAFSANRPENQRRILSLWLPRLPIDRIQRQFLRGSTSNKAREEDSNGTDGRLPPPLWGRAGERGKPHAPLLPPPPSLTLPHKGGGNGSAPCVVVAKQNNALVIYAIDEVAARSGLVIGLPLANARAICPELTVFDADETADRKTLNDIADWCDRFTPLVALDPPYGLYLDITGCAHLFGGEAALLQAVAVALTRQGFAVSAAIACNLDLRPHHGAACVGKNHP